MNKSRNAYIIYYEIGLICSLLVLIGAMNIPIEQKSKPQEQPPPEVPVIVDIPIVRKEKLPTPAKPDVPIERPVDLLFDPVIDLLDQVITDLPIELPSLVINSKPEQPEQAHILEGLLEKRPILIGGSQELYNQIVYPRLARRNRIEGTVFIEFILDENGKVINPVVIKGIGNGCDEEALRAIKKVTFTPGIQNGRRVKVKMSQAIIFRLKN